LIGGQVARRLTNMSLWGGRSFVETLILNQLDPNELRSKKGGRALRVLSYNVFSDTKCSTLRYTTSKKWENRRVALIAEIKTYDADVLCLQDVDHFEDWWRVQLMVLGYDSVFKKRTQKTELHYEGVAVAYKRDLFQLFKSVPINLNDAQHMDTGMGAGFASRLVTDDVGLLLLLQPYVSDFIESAILVGSCQFSSKDDDFDVRFVQAQFLTRQVELANREFQLPVVLGCSLNDSPNSPAYHVLRTGRKQLKPKAPGKMQAPFGKGFCRGSVRLLWYAPKLGRSDPPISTYKIAWRPGGSLTLGFSAQIEVLAPSTLQYGERVDARGVRKTFVKKELGFNITGLSSEMPFEFIVCAVNSVGQGMWSEPSPPIVMENPERQPRQAPLKNLFDVHRVGLLRENQTMGSNDWDVEIAINSNPVTSATQLTPRTITGERDVQVPRGPVLPLSVNPREGWKEELRGCGDPRVPELLGDVKAVFNSALRVLDATDPLRDPFLFQPHLVDSPRGKRAVDEADFEGAPFDHLGRPRFDALDSLLYAEGGDEGDVGRLLYDDDEDDGGGEEEEEEGGQVDDRSLLTDPALLEAEAEAEAWVGNEGLGLGLAGTGQHSPSPSPLPLLSATPPRRHSPRPVPAPEPGQGPGPGLRTGAGAGAAGPNPSSPERTAHLKALEERMRESGLVQQTIKRRLRRINQQLEQLKADNDGESVDSFDSRYRRLMASGLNDVDSVGSGSRQEAMSSSQASGLDASERRRRAIRALEEERAAQEAAFNAEVAQLTTLNLTALRYLSRTAQRLNDDTLLDGADVVLHLGRGDPRQLHNLSLRSAYESYSAGGEPLFTQSVPAPDGQTTGVACTDFIFFSGRSMFAERVLSMPGLTQFRGDDPQVLLSRPDPYWRTPPPFSAPAFGRHELLLHKNQIAPPMGGSSASGPVGKQQVADAKRLLSAALQRSLEAGGVRDKPPNGTRVGRAKEEKKRPPTGADCFWAGAWVPNAAYNPLRSHYWLPNDLFVSNHVALGAQIFLLEGQAATLWDVKRK